MRLLAVFDGKNYDPAWPRDRRVAVRAIILRGGEIAMVYSEREGYYKFPGGGVEKGESHLDALIRETREETGLTIRPDTARPFGMVREIRRSIYEPETIFDHSSYYYFSDVTAEITGMRLEPYERALGFHLAYAPLATAWEADKSLAGNYASSFLRREACVLGLLCRQRQDDAI